MFRFSAALWLAAFIWAQTLVALEKIVPTSGSTSAYNNSNVPCFDLFVPYHEADRGVFLGKDGKGGLGSGLYSLRKHIQDVRRMFIVSKNEGPFKLLLDANTIWFDEARFSFKLADFERGWDYQQIIKLMGPLEVPDLCETFAVVDADVIFVKDMRFVSRDGAGNEKLLYVYGKAVFHPDILYWHQFFNRAANHILGIRTLEGPSCAVHHQMAMQKEHLRHLHSVVSKAHGGASFLEVMKGVFAKAQAANHKQRKYMLASEYALYFVFMLRNHPDKMDITYLPYVHSQSVDDCGLDVLKAFQEESDVVFVTCHDNFNDTEPICVNSIDRCLTSLNIHNWAPQRAQFLCQPLGRIAQSKG